MNEMKLIQIKLIQSNSLNNKDIEGRQLFEFIDKSIKTLDGS